jgi:predicted DCC family thiol-disulfide oxidoreductase YuxK
MTSSFGITPQRQVRDLTQTPAAPERLPEPARPAATPEQVGGQLMYGRRFQEDTKTRQTLQSIESFLGENGMFQATQNLIFEKYKEDKKRQAETLLQQEAKALEDTQAIADETKRLQKQGEIALANQTRLSNPWVNFFFYDTKATNAGKFAAVELATWGKQQAFKLAEISSPAERAAAIANKAQELLKPYADVPEAFRAAKIDPLISATIADLKADVNNKAFELKDQTIKQTAADKAIGQWKLGALLGSTEFTANSISSGFFEHRNLLLQNGYSEREATEALFALWDRDAVFIDANNDTLTDIGETNSAANFIRAFEKITINGNPATELRDSKGRPLREAIAEAADRAQKRFESREKGIESNIARQQREFRREISDRSTEWWLANPNATQDQIARRIAEEEARIRSRGILPIGSSYQREVDFIRENYRFNNRILTPDQQVDVEEEVDNLIAGGTVDMPDYIKEKTRGTSIYGSLVKKFGDAKRRDNAADRSVLKQTQTSLVSQLVDRLSGSFQQDKEYQRLRGLDGYSTVARDALNNAVKAAKPVLKAESSEYIRRELEKARARGEDITNPTVQAQILKTAEEQFFKRPEFRDVDKYFNVTEVSKAGTRTSAVPFLSRKDPITGQWINEINDTDNRASWSATAGAVYGNNPKLAREVLKTRLVLNNTEIGELNNAIITGKPISQATKQSLLNLNQRAFKQNIPVSEIIERQISTYYGGKNLPPNLKAKSRLIAEQLRPVNAATGSAPSDVGIRITNLHHSHSKNRAIDFTPERQNGQLGNNVPSPISGRVIFAGNISGYGNTIVIEAASAGPGYNKGDRVLVGHLAQLYWKPGSQITRGRPVGKSGDGSAINSVPGRSTTGVGDPGHVHIQLFKPGAGFPNQAFQYESQQKQANFVLQNLVPLFGFKR